MHGKDISIPKGTEVTAYVNGDMKLDLAKFGSGPTVQQTAAAKGNLPNAGSTTATSAAIQLESNPTGADIEVDGRFAGNTPSELQMTEGDHTVTVKKTGFKEWERRLSVSAGSSVHLNAELERAAGQ